MKRIHLWLTFGLAMAATIPLRLFQLLFQLDEQGFYSDSGIVSIILTVLLFGATAVLLAGAFPSRHLPKRYSQQRDFPGGAAQIALGVLAVIYSIQEIFALGAGGSDRGLSGGLLYVAIILAFAGVGAGIVWIINGISCFLKRNLLRLIPMAGILPPIWMGILLFNQAVQLSGTTVTLNNNESFYNTMTMVLMTLFVFNHNKMIAGAQGKKCGRRVYGYGLAMTVFGVNSALPSVIAWITGGADAGAMGPWMSGLVLLLSLSAVLFLIMLPRGEEAFVEEFVEEKEEAPEAQEASVDPENPDAPVEQGKHLQKQKKEKKERSFRETVLAFLNAINKASEKLGNLFRGKRKHVPFEAGQLDEKPTMRVDESWRLDFYGMIEDADPNNPFRPEIHPLSAEQLAKQEARRAEVQAMLEAERETEKENELRIPEWKKKREAQKARYEKRYKR